MFANQVQGHQVLCESYAFQTGIPLLYGKCRIPALSKFSSGMTLREITYCHVGLVHTDGMGFEPSLQWRHQPQPPLFLTTL